MTEDREKWLRRIEAMLAKSEDPSCTEEERATFAKGAMDAMQKHAIEEYEVGKVSEKPRIMVCEKLNVKYANGWRVILAGVVANNCGIYSTYVGRLNLIQFWGQEHTVGAAKAVAEYLITSVEVLSKAHAKREGTGTKGRRDFAEGCAYRLCGIVKRSSNLSSDPRMPAIIKQSMEESTQFYLEENGKEARKGRVGSKRSGYSDSYEKGAAAAETIDTRGHQRQKQIQ